MKILLLQLKRIGDLVLTTPAIRCLREAFPDARLALVADSACASLLSCIDVDERWIYHKSGGARGLAGWGQNAWLRHGLLAFRPHWTLDFTGSDRSAYLSALSRSPRRTDSFCFLGPQWMAVDKSPSVDVHRIASDRVHRRIHDDRGNLCS